MQEREQELFSALPAQGLTMRGYGNEMVSRGMCSESYTAALCMSGIDPSVCG